MKKIQGGVTVAKGFKAAGLHSGIKKVKPDMALIATTTPAKVAGQFTTNLVQAAPLKVCQEHLKVSDQFSAIIINSGNANACTGQQGLQDAKKMASIVAQNLNCKTEEVLVASTGVIGVNLPMDKIASGIEKIVPKLSGDGGKDAAEAIMTTDTFSKEYAVKFELDGKEVRLGGIAKGSGMIHPNMATMLAFITTDAAISTNLLRQALSSAVAKSFNMITVDGDTSTNDTVLLLANGEANNKEITEENSHFAKFSEALLQVTTELAKAIAKDGEGATKFVEVQVVGASTDEVASKVALSIAGSNLVKTALFGEDANWGRIICAAGYSGADFDPDKVKIYLGDLQVGDYGRGIDFSEEQAKEILSNSEIILKVDLQSGSSQATAWTCDLTFDYIKINASYRT